MRANHEAISLADAAILQRPKSTPPLSIRRPLYQWHLWHAMPTAERPMGFAFPQELNFITKLFTYTNSTQVSSTILWSVPFCGAHKQAAAMSYMKSIHAAKKASEGTMVRNEFEGPLDILIVSPAKGEPWYIYIKKEQLSKDGAFICFKKFIKEYKHNAQVRWSFTWDKIDRWHSVRARAALPCLARTSTKPLQCRR